MVTKNVCSKLCLFKEEILECFLADFTVWRPSNGFWYTLSSGRPSIQMMKHWGFTVNDTAGKTIDIVEFE